MITSISTETSRYYYALTEHLSSWGDAVSRAIIRFLFIQSGGRVLEIGCGTATIIPHLPPSWDYTGVDVSDFALERARLNFPQATFLRAASSNLPLLDASFDAVFLIHALEHFENPKVALDEIMRVLKPGGRGVVIGPNLDFPLSLPNAVRQWGGRRRFLLRCRRIADYLLRIVGVLTFRIVYPNYTEETGRYERPDDDLRYLISADEVAQYIVSRGMILEKLPAVFFQKKISRIKRAMRIIPGMSRYGTGMSLFFRK